MYWLFLDTIKAEWGFILLLAGFILWSIGVYILAHIITRIDMIATEKDRYPEKVKAVLMMKNIEIKRLNKKIARRDEHISMLIGRLQGARAWATLTSHRFGAALNKVVEIIEGIK